MPRNVGGGQVFARRKEHASTVECNVAMPNDDCVFACEIHLQLPVVWVPVVPSYKLTCRHDVLQLFPRDAKLFLLACSVRQHHSIVSFAKS